MEKDQSVDTYGLAYLSYRGAESVSRVMQLGEQGSSYISNYINIKGYPAGWWYSFGDGNTPSQLCCVIEILTDSY